MSERKRQRAEKTLAGQIGLLTQAFEVGGEYLSEDWQEHWQQVIDHAVERRELSGGHTVIGLFGATGSGKSSLFNALVGRDLARTGAVRPTTKTVVAAIWEQQGAGELLDWLGVRERHSVSEPLEGKTSSRRAAHTAGLLLLDLPDIDSTATEHHGIATRLAGQVDFLIWVLDPQKYADASIHHGYLADSANQSSNLLVVLNQVDNIAPVERKEVLDSLGSILTAQGLDAVPVITASTVTGEGVDAVRSRITTVMRDTELAIQRVRNDVDALANELDESLLTHHAPMPLPREQDELELTIAEANGTGRIADAVAVSYKLRAARSTGWPLTAWLVRLRNDPLKRMNLGRNEKSADLALTSRPDLSAAEKAQIDQAVNRFVRLATDSLPEQWALPLQDQLADSQKAMDGEIDLAIAGTWLGVERGSWWWPLIKVLQWTSVVVGLAGALWLGGLALAGFLQFSLPEAPRIEGIALPTLLLAIGVLAGIVLGIGSSIFSRLMARIKRRKVLGNLNKSVAHVVRQVVVDRTREHLDRFNNYAALIRQAAKKAQ